MRGFRVFCALSLRVLVLFIFNLTVEDVVLFGLADILYSHDTPIVSVVNYT